MNPPPPMPQRVRLGHAEHARGGHRGVDRVAAVAQRLDRGARAVDVDGRGGTAAADGGRLLLVLGERGGRVENDQRDERDDEQASKECEACDRHRPLVTRSSAGDNLA